MLSVVLFHPGAGNRLDDEVDVDRLGVHVRPEGDVDLLGCFQPCDDCRCLLKNGAQLGSLGLVEVRDMNDMALRLDDQGPNAQRPDAMVDVPEVGFVDAASR